MMKTKYFVDTAGNYIGGFAGAKPPPGAIEVPRAPAHGLDTWDGTQWVPHKASAPASLADRIIADPDQLVKLKRALEKMT